MDAFNRMRHCRQKFHFYFTEFDVAYLSKSTRLDKLFVSMLIVHIILWSSKLWKWHYGMYYCCANVMGTLNWLIRYIFSTVQNHGHDLGLKPQGSWLFRNMRWLCAKNTHRLNINICRDISDNVGSVCVECGWFLAIRTVYWVTL